MFSAHVNAASVGSAICSVTPASGSIAQNGELSFTVSTNATSTGVDLVLISVTNFSNGVYSDIGPGRAIPVGANSLSFKVHAGNNAETGNKTFKVYCSRDTYVGGSAGGGTAQILDSATVSLNVTGTNPSGEVLAVLVLLFVLLLQILIFFRIVVILLNLIFHQKLEPLLVVILNYLDHQIWVLVLPLLQSAHL